MVYSKPVLIKRKDDPRSQWNSSFPLHWHFANKPKGNQKFCEKKKVKFFSFVKEHTCKMFILNV